MAADENYALYVAQSDPTLGSLVKDAGGDPAIIKAAIQRKLLEGDETTMRAMTGAPVPSEWKRIGVTNAQAAATITTSALAGAPLGILGMVAGGIEGWYTATQQMETAKKAKDEQAASIKSGEMAKLREESIQLEAFSKEAQRKWGTSLSVTDEEQRKQLETLRSVVGGRTEKDILQSMAALMAGNGIRVIDVTPKKNK
jgi:hypothetical protein